jgi:inorganic triphosphatase YgiF
VLAPTSDREVELKLLVDPAKLTEIADRLRNSPTAFSRDAARWLESRYFDTPDRRLARRGVSLRVRRIAGVGAESGDDASFLQTVKASGVSQGAHLERGEWECAVEDWTPRLERVTDRTALERLGLVLQEELELVVASEIERHVVLVEQPVPGEPAAIIEVAFDSGRLIARPSGDDAADRVLPIAEIELELKTGPTRGLYLLLGELRRWGRLEISTADKAQRGFRLAAGTWPTAVRASKVALEPWMTTGEALGGILDNCLGQWLRNIPAAADGRDIEGVHQLRIAIRRSRSALSLFAEALDPSERKAWNTRLKSVITATGPARQRDVFASELLPMISATAPPAAATPLAALAARLEAERSAAYDEVRRFLASDEHATLLLDWASWVALEGWREGAGEAVEQALARPVVELARDLLRKRHKRVKKLGQGFATLADEERHEVRLALKKLRYGVEFLGGLFPNKTAKRYAKAAAALQDELGILNDQAEARTLLDELAASAPAEPAAERLHLERGIGFVLGWQAEALSHRRNAATEAWQTFIAQEPFWRGADAKP